MQNKRHHHQIHPYKVSSNILTNENKQRKRHHHKRHPYKVSTIARSYQNLQSFGHHFGMHSYRAINKTSKQSYCIYSCFHIYVCICVYIHICIALRYRLQRVENFEKDTIGGFADDDGRNQLQSHWHPACPGPSARAHDDHDDDNRDDDEVEMLMMMIMQRTSKALRARHPAYTRPWTSSQTKNALLNLQC